MATTIRQQPVEQNKTNPQLKRLVYSKYREMLGNYNDKANTIIQSLPAYMVTEDKGFNFDHIKDISTLSSNGNHHHHQHHHQYSEDLVDRDNRHGQGPPACVQNAMMTKDKKPFTYTPSGIDLSQIKSPRMAKRIAHNAQLEGVTNQPRPSPLAAQNNQGGAAPTMAAQAVGMPVQVFPTGPPPPPPPQPQKGGAAGAPPPPPPPGKNTLAPQTNGAAARKTPSPMQKFEPPPMGFRPEIKIPTNPMAALRKVPKPKEKNDFWVEEYKRDKSNSPMPASANTASANSSPANDYQRSPSPAVRQEEEEQFREPSPAKFTPPQQLSTPSTPYSQQTSSQPSTPYSQPTSSQPSTPYSPMKSPALAQQAQQPQYDQSYNTSPSPIKTPAINQLSLYEQQQNRGQSPLRSPAVQQTQQYELNRDQSPLRSPAISQIQNQYQQQVNRSQSPQRTQMPQPGRTESPFNTPKDNSSLPRPLSPVRVNSNQQSPQPQYPYGRSNYQATTNVSSPTQKEQQEPQPKNSQVGSLYIPPVAPENLAHHQQQSQQQQQQSQLNSQSGGARKGAPPNRWVTPTKDVPDWARQNDTTRQQTPSCQEYSPQQTQPQVQQQQQYAAQPSANRWPQQQAQQQHQYQQQQQQQQTSHLQQQNPGLKLQMNNPPMQSGTQSRERIIPIEIERTPTSNPSTPGFPGSNQNSSTPGSASSPGYITRNPNQFVDQGYQNYPGQQQQQQQQRTNQQQVAGTRVIPIAVENNGGAGSPFNANSVRGPVSQQPMVIQKDNYRIIVHDIPLEAEIRYRKARLSDPRAPQAQNSWGAGNNTNGPSQSKSFRILQKITSTEDSDDGSNRSSPAIKNNGMQSNDNSPRPNFARQMGSNGFLSNQPTPPQSPLIDNEQLKRMQINEQDHLNFMNRVRSQGTPPIMRQTQPPRFTQQPGGYYNDDYSQHQQQYVHPSEQIVPEPKIYTGSAIPSRSFKLLQQMTTPENAAEMEGSDVEHDQISSNSSNSSPNNDNNDNTDNDNTNRNNTNSECKNYSSNNRVQPSPTPSDPPNYPYAYPPFPPYMFPPYPPPYQYPISNLQSGDMKNWPYPPPPYPYYYPYYPPLPLPPHPHHIPPEYDPQNFNGSYNGSNGSIYGSYDSNNLVRKRRNLARSRNAMNNAVTNGWRNSAPPNIIVTQSFDETEEEELTAQENHDTIEDSTASRGHRASSVVVASNCQKPDLAVRCSSVAPETPDTTSINAKEMISKFNSLVEAEEKEKNSKVIKNGTAKQEAYVCTEPKRNERESSVIDELSIKLGLIKNTNINNLNLSQLCDKTYVGDKNKQISKQNSETPSPNLNTSSSNSPISNFTQSDNETIPNKSESKCDETSSEDDSSSSFTETEDSEDSSLEEYEEPPLLASNKSVRDIQAYNTETDEDPTTANSKILDQDDLDNATDIGDDSFFDRSIDKFNEDEYQKMFDQMKASNSEFELESTYTKEIPENGGDEDDKCFSESDTVEAFDNDDKTVEDSDSDSEILEENMNLVSVRLPLKFSFSRSENDENVTTVEVGTSEIQDSSSSRRSSITSIKDDADLNNLSPSSSNASNKEDPRIASKLKSGLRQTSITDIKDELKRISYCFDLEESELPIDFPELNEKVSLKADLQETFKRGKSESKYDDEENSVHDSGRRFSITSIQAVDSEDCDVSVTVNLSTVRSGSNISFRSNEGLNRPKSVEKSFKKEDSVVTDDEEVSVSFSLNMRNKFLGETCKGSLTNNIAKSDSQASSNDCGDLMTETQEMILETEKLPVKNFGTTSEATQTTWEEHSKVTSMLIAKWAYNNRDLEEDDEEVQNNACNDDSNFVAETEPVDFCGSIKTTHTTNVDTNLDLATNIEETQVSEENEEEIDFWATINNHDDDGYHRTPIKHNESTDDFWTTKTITKDGQLISETSAADSICADANGFKSSVTVPCVPALTVNIAADLWTTNESVTESKQVQKTDNENNVDFWGHVKNEEENRSVHVTKNLDGVKLVCNREYAFDKHTFGAITPNNAVSDIWQTREADKECESHTVKLEESVTPRVEKAIEDKGDKFIDYWHNSTITNSQAEQCSNEVNENVEKNLLNAKEDEEVLNQCNKSRCDSLELTKKKSKSKKRDKNLVEDTNVITSQPTESIVATNNSKSTNFEDKKEDRCEELGNENLDIRDRFIKHCDTLEILEKKMRSKKPRKDSEHQISISKDAEVNRKDISKNEEQPKPEMTKVVKEENVTQKEAKEIKSKSKKKPKEAKCELEKNNPEVLEVLKKDKTKKNKRSKEEPNIESQAVITSNGINECKNNFAEVVERNSKVQVSAPEPPQHIEAVASPSKLNEVELISSEKKAKKTKKHHSKDKTKEIASESVTDDSVEAKREKKKEKKSHKHKNKTAEKYMEVPNESFKAMSSGFFEPWCPVESVQYFDEPTTANQTVPADIEDKVDDKEINFGGARDYFEKITQDAGVPENQNITHNSTQMNNTEYMQQSEIDFWGAIEETHKHDNYNSTSNYDQSYNNGYSQYNVMNESNRNYCGNLEYQQNYSGNTMEFNNTGFGQEQMETYPEKGETEPYEPTEEKAECQNNYRKAMDFFKRRNSLNPNEESHQNDRSRTRDFSKRDSSSTRRTCSEVRYDQSHSRRDTSATRFESDRSRRESDVFVNDQEMARRDSSMRCESVKPRRGSSCSSYDTYRPQREAIMSELTSKINSNSVKSDVRNNSQAHQSTDSFRRESIESSTRNSNSTCYEVDRSRRASSTAKHEERLQREQSIMYAEKTRYSEPEPVVASNNNYFQYYNGQPHDEEECEEIEIEIIHESDDNFINNNNFQNHHQNQMCNNAENVGGRNGDQSKPSVRDKIMAFETGKVEPAKDTQKLDVQNSSDNSKENSKDNLSRTSSLQRSESEIEEDDSGVTDMSKLISETDTESECFPELRKLSRYERAATHSRLFKLLADEGVPDSKSPGEQFGEMTEEEKKLLEEFNFKPSRRKIVHNVSITRRNNPEAIKNAETMSQRRERLSLPLKTSVSIDSDNLSTSNSPMSPATSTNNAGKAVSDQLVNELIQSLMLKTNGNQFKHLPMEKIQAAAKLVLEEHLDSLDNTSLESTPALTPQEFKTDSYSDYYDSWNNNNNSNTNKISNNSSSSSIASGSTDNKYDKLPSGFRRGRSLARCPRVISSKTVNSDLTRISESPDIFRGVSATRSSIEKDAENAFRYVRSNSTTRWGKV